MLSDTTQIRFADYATNFATREIARDILVGMRNKIGGGHTRLILDFNHVVVVSPSFASEVVRQTEQLLEGSSVTEAILSGCEPSVYLVFREVLERPSLQRTVKDAGDSLPSPRVRLTLAKSG